MRILIQRVKRATVEVEEKVVGKIEQGLLVFLGVTHKDTKKQVDYLVKKICGLRIFEDENEKMNLSIEQIKGSILVVSQFTLYGDCTNGNRPSFTGAAKPEIAKELYEYFIQQCKQRGITTQNGVFGAHMKIELLNDGPVTILIEKEETI